MSIGLIALLDDVAALTKVAAASLDDVATLSARAGVKAAGVVIDDAAVTPRYVVGFQPDRELPIVWRIARGSLRNKVLFLLPGALVLSVFAPWIITPLLAAGGVYLAYEGAEKVYEALAPHKAEAHEAALVTDPADLRALEDTRVASAIKTDFILSAEIMAITLSGLPEGSLWLRGAVLAVVAVGITAAVYGGVALIVKADDAGLALARRGTGALAALGRGIVRVMPGFLSTLAAVGTAAMIWVGGGIVVHALEVYGFAAPAHWIHDAAEGAGALAPAGGGLVGWMVGALGSGLVGLVVGALAIPAVSFVLAPLVRLVTPARPAGAQGAVGSE